MEGQAIGSGYAAGVNRNQSHLQQGAGTVPKAVNPSCFGNIEDVVSSAESAAARVERVVNRLIGEEPQDPNAEGKPAAFGLLNIADEHARDIRRYLQRIFHAVERLEKQLP